MTNALPVFLEDVIEAYQKKKKDRCYGEVSLRVIAPLIIVCLILQSK